MNFQGSSASNGRNSGYLATHLMGPLRSTSTTQPSAPRMQNNSERMAGCVVAVHHNHLKHTYDSSEFGVWSSYKGSVKNAKLTKSYAHKTIEGSCWSGISRPGLPCAPSHGWARLALAGHGQIWHPWPSMTSHDGPWPAMARRNDWMPDWMAMSTLKMQPPTLKETRQAMAGTLGTFFLRASNTIQ